MLGISSGNLKKKLAFKKKEGFPDFENPEDKDTENNVYEVTIVVKDSTVDKQGNPHKDELNVTVKVINSTEDNEPGKVVISNRQPEVNTVLEAVLTDPDKVDTTKAMAMAVVQGGRPPLMKMVNLVLLLEHQHVSHAGATGATGVLITPEFSNPNGIDAVNERRHFLESANPGAVAGTAVVWKRSRGQTHANTRRSSQTSVTVPAGHGGVQ